MRSHRGNGWGIILYQALMFFLLIEFSIDGLNIVAPALSESSGVDYPSVLSMASIAGYVGILVYIIAGDTLIAQWFPKKKGLANGLSLLALLTLALGSAPPSTTRTSPQAGV